MKLPVLLAAVILLPDQRPVPISTTAVEIEYVSAPNIPGPPRPVTVEPPLGIEVAVRQTNYAGPSFEPIGCQFCERVHHHRVIESYTVTESNVVPALVGGERRLLSVGTARTNLAMIYTTNYVEHPAAYPQQTRGVRMAYPPLPPAPEVIYQQNRSNYLRRMDPTRGEVKPPSNPPNPQQKLEAGLAALPRRSNTSTFVPP